MYQEEEKTVNEEVKEVSNEEETKPVEETPVENPEEKSEAKAEEKPQGKPNKKEVKNPDECFDIARSDDEDEIVNQIEAERKVLVEQFNKTKLISRIMTAVVLVAVIGAIIMIFNESTTLKIIGYSLAGATLVGMLVYYIITKDKFPRASRTYISNVTNNINTYVFTDKRFTDLKVYPYKKLNRTDLEVDRVYANSNDIGSRNVITGKFDKHEFSVSENVLYSLVPGRKGQRSVLFLGKYISLTNNKKFDGRFIFNVKGNPEKLVDQPNDIEDCKVVLEEDNLVVYSSNDKSVKDVFGTKFLSELKEIKTDERLLNFVLVVWAGHTAAYLSYDDAVTVLPFEHEFNREAQNEYKEDLIKVLELTTQKK